MLHGRERELETLRARLAQAREGRSFALAVTGEAGIGKTSLLRAVAEEAEGFRVLRARGFPGEAEIPYAGLLELARPLLDLADALPGQQAAALQSALALGPPAEHSRFAVPAALLALLGAAAEEGPVLVLVDDAHWLDAATREALFFAARRLHAEGVGVLLGVRTGAGAETLDFAGLEVLALGGLDRHGARALLEGRVAPSVAEALVGATGGNPLALLELPAVLTDEERRGLRPITTPLAGGDLVEQLFSARIASLPEPTRRALGAAAATDDGRLDQLFGALGRLGLSEVDLGPAEQEGVVAVRGTRLAFSHPLVRAAAYQSQTVAERHAVHAALADASEDPRQAAWHRAQASPGPDAQVADALADAAQDAAQRGGRAEAARTFARAAELTPDRHVAAQRRLAAAAAAQDAGDADRARALLDGAEAGPLTDAERGDARRLRAILALRAGDADTGVRLLEEEAARIVADDPLGAATTLLLTAPGHMHNGDFVALLDVAGRAQELAGDRDPEAAALASDLVALTKSAMGRTDEVAIEVLDTASERDVTRGPGEVTLACTEGVYLRERHMRALELLDGHVERARAEGAVLMLLYALAIRSRLHHRIGRWAAARADAEEAVELHRGVAEDTIFSPYVYAVAAVTQMDSGDLGEGRRLATASLAAGTRSGSQTILLWTHWARGRLALLEGRTREAVEILLEGERVAERIQWGAPAAAETRADLGEALAAEGDLDAVRSFAARLRADREPGVRLPEAVAARLEGIAAADDAFEERFAEALEHHDALAMPFERGRTLLALGVRRRRARRATDAREPLQQALEAFERLGAEPWTARAREELRLAGTTGPAAAAAAADPEQALSGQEWRISELVAQGLTNREVGAALFLSPKTIEHHLSAIYRKLGVRSRTQLAAALGERAA